MSFTVAIVGRPNVGKSTLFNRLAGKRLALVDDQPGLTRDRREAETVLGTCPVTLVDTAGLESGDEGLSARMRQQTEEAIAQAACKAAVKARDRLTLAEIEKLVVDLARTDMPYTCPHGRPTVILESFHDLNKKFGRE